MSLEQIIEDVLNYGVCKVESYSFIQSNGIEVEPTLLSLVYGEYEIIDNDGYEISMLRNGEKIWKLYDWTPSTEANVWIKTKFYERFQD